jgi:uncharacterized protein
MSRVWIPSRYNVHADLPDGDKVVGNLFTGAIEVVDADTWARYLEDGASYSPPREKVAAAALELFDLGLIVPGECDERELLRHYYQGLRYDESSQLVSISPTLACNLNCPYCFQGGVQEAGDLKPMSADTADAVASFVIEVSDGAEKLGISWFGGEPLMCLDIIRRISSRTMEGLSPKGVRFGAGVITNGVLLTSNAVEVLRESGVRRCRITIDVPGATKVDSRGRAVQELQLDNAANAADRLDITFRVNVTADDEAEFDRFFERLTERGLERKLRNVHFARVVPVECGRTDCGSPTLSNGEFFAVLRRERVKALELGLPFQDFLPGTARPCEATRVAYCLIGPDGSLYKCQYDLGIKDRAHGNVIGHHPPRPHKLLPWLTYDWFQYPECEDCIFLPQCTGGCPHRRIYDYGGEQCMSFLEQLDKELPEDLASWALEQRENGPSSR